MSRAKITLLFTFFLYSVCEAQQVNFIKYTVQDGLVANPVRCIYQDKKGFIWVGTFEGLSRYDGYKFVNYTTSNGLSHHFVNAILEVGNKMLIAENNGAIDVFQNDAFKKGFMLSSAANSLIYHHDRLLVTTDGSGFYEFRNDSIISPVQEKTNSALGHFISVNDSLLLTDGVDNNLLLYKSDFTLKTSLRNLGVHFYSLFRDSKKRIWGCTSGGLKLIQVPFAQGQQIQFPSLPPEFNFYPLNRAEVACMIEEPDGGFWIGTLKGLVHLRPGGSYEVYNEKDGLPSAIIYTLYRDRENNLWIGTALGLAKWASRSNVVFYNTETKIFKNDVNSIFRLGQDAVVLKTDHGLQQFSFAAKEFKDINNTASYFTPISGALPLLLHYDDKIVELNSGLNKSRVVRTLNTTVPGVLFSAVHPNGTLLLGGFGGLYAIEKNSVKRLLRNRITCMTLDKNGNLWAGTWTEGLFRIEIKDNAENRYEVHDLTTTINNSQIRGLYADSKNNVWVGTRYDGAICISTKPNGQVELSHYNRQSGLMSDWVNCFAETFSGDIWVATYLGLDKLVKEPGGFRVFNFSKVVNFFAEIKNIIAINDSSWLCMANRGIAYFKDEEIHQTKPLQAAILSTSLGLLENKLTIFSPVETVSLSPTQNAARFEFSAPGFMNEKQVLYSYRLKGSRDTAWSKPENIHEASYASLSPGHYTFEVKTIGWNGKDGNPATFSFYISTPFWKQWWFLALCALLVIGFLYGLYKYRIRQLLRLHKVRNSIATDLHDDIGSSLTNISILSKLSSKNIQEPEKAQPFLQRIFEEVQASSQAMDDIIWSVNTHNDSLEEIMARMRRYAAELFDKTETECHLELDENTGNKKMTMEQRRDVYLIYKEALNNIHKHAAAKNIWIRVDQNHKFLSMQVKDDGKGFNTESVTHRNGLKNLKTRVEKWNGKIAIRSQQDAGTDIDIKIPLKS